MLDKNYLVFTGNRDPLDPSFSGIFPDPAGSSLSGVQEDHALLGSQVLLPGSKQLPDELSPSPAGTTGYSAPSIQDTIQRQAAPQPDSLQLDDTVPRGDSLPGQPEVLPPDSLQAEDAVTSPDSLQIQTDEFLPDSTDGHATPSLPDAPQIAVPAPGQDAGGQESVWDRIDNREREIQATREDTPVRQVTTPPPEISEPLPEPGYKHDASWYLDPLTDTPFFREHIFPDPLAGGNVQAHNREVFLETGTRSFTGSSTEYKTYLENDISRNYNDNTLLAAAWIPGLVILSLLLLTWIKMAYVQFLTPVLFSTFNYKEALKLYNSKNTPASNAFIILHLIFAVNSGLFLLFVAGYFNFNLPEISPPLLFLSASGFIVLLFAFKSAALSITGFLFDSSGFFAEYSHNISLYNKIFGILLMPVIVGLLYADPEVHGKLVYTGLAIGAVIYILQLVRGLEIIVRKEFSVFYLILYLCTFEILPLFAIYKLLQTFI